MSVSGSEGTPRMSGLTKKEAAYVAAYVETGNRHEALKVAGYTGNANTLRKTLWNLRKRPHVRAAIRERTLEAFEEDAPLGRAVLRELAEDKSQPGAVRKSAAEALVERSLGKVAEQHDHRLSVEMLTPEQIIERRNALRARLGLPLVGNSGGNASQVIDGESAVTGLRDLSPEKAA